MTPQLKKLRAPTNVRLPSEGRALVVSEAEPSARPQGGLEKKGLSAPEVNLVAASPLCALSVLCGETRSEFTTERTEIQIASCMRVRK